MAQIFHRSFNVISRVTIFGFIFFIAALGWVGARVVRSPIYTNAFVAVDQPVPFSHEHHVGQLKIDCRFCHTSVTESAFAGLPSTHICMKCHSQVWTGSPMLEPVRESYRTGKSIEWQRVHKLPDFSKFNHSIHINKGIGCFSCHGRVDQMPLTWQVHTLHMNWCLECHRNPEKHVRPREEVFNLGWQRPADFDPQKYMAEYDIKRKTDCSTCHR